MLTLLIPDLHHRTEFADTIAARELAERIVVLGDCLDDFHDGPLDAERTARWMRRRLEDQWELLLGNHDLPYGFWHEQHWCPGYSRPKAVAVKRQMTREFWRRTRLWTWVGPWLVSHAGLHPSFIPPVGTGRSTRDALDVLHAEVTDLLHRGETHPLLQAGRSRGFENPHGGVLWMDWEELAPVDGLHQVVGHTPSPAVRLKGGPLSHNVCLDVSATCYALVDGAGRLTVKTVHGNAGEAKVVHELDGPPG